MSVVINSRFGRLLDQDVEGRPLFDLGCPDVYGPYHARLLHNDIEGRRLYGVILCQLANSSSSSSSSAEPSTALNSAGSSSSGSDLPLLRLARLVDQDVEERPLYAVEDPCCPEVEPSFSGSRSESSSSSSSSSHSSSSSSSSGSLSGSHSDQLSLPSDNLSRSAGGTITGTCFSLLPATLHLDIASTGPSPDPAIVDCSCLPPTANAPRVSVSPGQVIWQTGLLGSSCRVGSDFSADITCDDLGGGLHRISVAIVSVNCTPTNVGNASVIVTSADLATLDVTLPIDIVDTVYSTGCGTCRWSWIAMAGMWNMVSSSCVGYCDCLNEPAFPGAFDGQEVDVDCVQVNSPCCLGPITVRVTR